MQYNLSCLAAFKNNHEKNEELPFLWNVSFFLHNSFHYAVYFTGH